MAKKATNSLFSAFDGLAPLRRTLRGTAVFPALQTPDTRFNPDGVFQVELQLTREEMEELSESVLEPRLQLAVDRVRKANPGKKVEEAQLPFRPAKDDGEFLLRFRVKAKWSDGSERVIPIVDANKKEFAGVIGTGSDITVAYEVRPWAMADSARRGTINVGLTLAPLAVQVNKHRPPGSGAAALDMFEVIGEEGDFGDDA
jgi:hypothetical protein